MKLIERKDLLGADLFADAWISFGRTYTGKPRPVVVEVLTVPTANAKVSFRHHYTPDTCEKGKPYVVIRFPLPWYGEKESHRFWGKEVGWMIPSLRWFGFSNWYFITLMRTTKKELHECDRGKTW